MLCLHLSVFAIYAHNEKVALSDSSDWVCTSLGGYIYMKINMEKWDSIEYI